MLYPSDTKTSIAFSPIFLDYLMSLYSPCQTSTPIAKDQNILHYMEGLPKMVGHSVGNSDVSELLKVTQRRLYLV